MDRQFIKEAASAAHAKLPDGYGFILLAMPYSKQGDGRLVYASNIERSAAIAALKEWLLKCGAAEDWMKHIK